MIRAASRKKAEAYVKSIGVGDTCYFGPEAEFFRGSTTCAGAPIRTTPAIRSISTELPFNTGKAYEGGNTGFRPGPKGGYFPVPPIDSLQDMRGEMLSIMNEIGLGRLRSTTTKWPPHSTNWV